MQKLSDAVVEAPFQKEVDETLAGGFDLLLDEILLFDHFEVASEEVDSGVVGHIFELKELFLRVVFFGAVAVDVSEEPVDPEGLQVLLIEEKVSGLFFLLGVHESLPLNIILIFVLQSQDGHLVVLAASCASVVSLDLFVLVDQIVFIVVIIDEASILKFLGEGLNFFDLEDGVVADVEP